MAFFCGLLTGAILVISVLSVIAYISINNKKKGVKK